MSESSREIKLAPGEELSLEVLGAELSLTLQNGFVEYYGCPLDLGVPYSFPMGTLLLVKAPVDTPYESILQIVGKFNIQGSPQRCAYSADLVNLIDYLNVRRTHAMNGGTAGPVVLVCGKKGAGKSRLCRMLCNSAVAQNFHLELIDFSTSENSITLPRHVASVIIQDFFPPVGDIEHRSPVIFPFDYGVFPEPLQEAHWGLWERIARKLFSLHNIQASKCPRLRCGGIVIKVPESIFLRKREDGHNGIHPAMALIAKVFGVEHVCIVENQEGNYDALNIFRASELQKTKYLHRLEFMCTKNVSLGRTVDKSHEKIHNYFHGSAFKLKCFQIAVDYTRLVFYGAHVESVPNLTPQRLNIEENSQAYSSRLASVIDVRQDEDISLARVVGFVVIVRVDTTSQKLYLVTPSPSIIPTNHMFITKFFTDADELLYS